jgi:hypothetical protein
MSENWEDRVMDTVGELPWAIAKRLPWRWLRFAAQPALMVVFAPLWIAAILPCLLTSMVRGMWQESA